MGKSWLALETKQDPMMGDSIFMARVSQEAFMNEAVFDEVLKGISAALIDKISDEVKEAIMGDVIKRLNLDAIANAVSVRIMPELVKRTIGEGK